MSTAGQIFNSIGFFAKSIFIASIDRGQSRDFKTHQILGAANKPAVENIANLDKLPPKGAMLYVMPMKIKGGSGAPARIFAVLP